MGKTIRKRILTTFAFAVSGIFVSCGGSDEPTPPVDNPDIPKVSVFDTYTAENIYSQNVKMPKTAFMQGFSIANDGTVWYTTCVGADLFISKLKPNHDKEPASSDKGYMTLSFFGHGTNSAIEECDGETYIWAGCFGSCTDKENYWKEKLVCRTKFIPGATIKTDECDEYYYIGEGTFNVQPTVDMEHNRLAIQYNGNGGNTVDFEIYDLTEAKNAPLKKITITCTDGFRTGVRTSLKQTQVTVEVRDLTAIKPLASPRCLWKTNPTLTYYPWQGYDINGDRLYFVEGGDNGFSTDKKSYAYLTVYSLSGSVIEPRTQIKAVSDFDFLADNGISVSGTLESEGVKVKDGKIYLGFCNRGIRVDNRNAYQTILRFDIPGK